MVHSFASWALALGKKLPMIGKLLGYAHVARHSVKTAGERVAVSLASEFGAIRDYMRTCPATDG